MTAVFGNGSYTPETGRGSGRSARQKSANDDAQPFPQSISISRKIIASLPMLRQWRWCQIIFFHQMKESFELLRSRTK